MNHLKKQTRTYHENHVCLNQESKWRKLIWLVDLDEYKNGASCFEDKFRRKEKLHISSLLLILHPATTKYFLSSRTKTLSMAKKYIVCFQKSRKMKFSDWKSFENYFFTTNRCSFLSGVPTRAR